MKITIIGTGYVGLVSGAVFADWGNQVVCLDIDQTKIDKINNGIMPIFEEGLEELVAKVIKSKYFTTTTDYKKAIDHGDLIFICVGTPSNQDGAADLRYVFTVAKEIARHIKSDSNKVIITKSTVPVGTNNKIKDIIKANSNGKFNVVSNPEFLREGMSLYDANNPDRVVLGGDSLEAIEKVASIYKHLKTSVVKTDIKSAELIKYASNAFLATKIAFINEISQICEKVGADVRDVAKGMGLDKRIGEAFLSASIGFGGSCFPKDVEALYRTSSENMYDFRLLSGVIDANSVQKHYFLDKIWRKYGHNLTGLTFGVLGAAFKAKTDDVRKSVALDIIRILRGSGANIKLYDPEALENAKGELGSSCVEFCNKPDHVFDKVDGLLILTEWQEFKEIDYLALTTKMNQKVIFDGRNLLDKDSIKKITEYFCIGSA